MLKGYPFYKYIVNYHPFGNGHINKTYLVETTIGKYILQQINTNVFKKPKYVMQNIDLVTKYIKMRGGKTLEIVKDNHGKKLKKVENCYWRCYKYIEGGETLEISTDDKIFYEIGKAIGDFSFLLTDFPIKKLKITIPNFHNALKRYEKLFSLINNNAKVNNCFLEIRFVSEHKLLIKEYMNKLNSVPIRVTHNDTKLNNIMINSNTCQAICLIDLDTVMPGSLLFDYGDAIRVATNKAKEDEKDLRKVKINKKIFYSLSKGFLEKTYPILTDIEKELLFESAKIITLECGIRFLTDYLENDVYFKTDYPNHNLIRAKNQFKLVKEMEREENIYQNIIKSILKQLENKGV